MEAHALSNEAGRVFPNNGGGPPPVDMGFELTFSAGGGEPRTWPKEEQTDRVANPGSAHDGLGLYLTFGRAPILARGMSSSAPWGAWEAAALPEPFRPLLR